MHDALLATSGPENAAKWGPIQSDWNLRHIEARDKIYCREPLVRVM